MTDKQAFLAAIAANPDDDTPRLVYADYLDGIGEGERAEFVRDCCQVLARHTDCPTRLADLKSGRPVPLRCGVCDYCFARRRAERFYARHQWMTGTPYAVCFEPTPLDGDLPTGPGITLVVSRGFVSQIRLDWHSWLAHADALTWHPGERCGRCAGSGQGPDWATRSDPAEAWQIIPTLCPACHGTAVRPCPETVCPGLAVTFVGEDGPRVEVWSTPQPDWVQAEVGGREIHVPRSELPAVGQMPHPPYGGPVVEFFLRHRWPGVKSWQFEPAVDPTAPDDLPAYGWEIRVEEERSIVGYLPTRSGALRCRVPGLLRVERGRRFGPLVARERGGGLYNVPQAVVTNVTIDAMRRYTEIEAAAVGEFGR